MKKKITDEQISAVRREYFRKWRATHKDNVRQHNQTYWRKKALEREGVEGNDADTEAGCRAD